MLIKQVIQELLGVENILEIPIKVYDSSCDTYYPIISLEMRDVLTVEIKAWDSNREDLLCMFPLEELKKEIENRKNGSTNDSN